MLKIMFKWTKNYEIGTDNLRGKLVPYNQKLSVIKTHMDIKQYINKHQNTAIGNENLDFVDCLLFAYSDQFNVFTFDEKLKKLINGR